MSERPGIDLELIGSRILDIPGFKADLPWYVAYSGGIDSTVLLHVLSRIHPRPGRLVALHADHGLQADSGQWRRHCERQCADWGIECRTTRLSFAREGGHGPEGNAREARYRWFRDAAAGGACLFTAHHRGDQAETVIERLARGAGPRGLRAMLPVSSVYGVKVVRPLLEVPRAAIEAYAAEHRLRWITDDSNEDPHFTRNFIRRRVLPLLEDRWPRMERALARTAQSMGDAQLILEQAAEADLLDIQGPPSGGEPSLQVPALMALAPARQRNVLRHWIHRHCGVLLAPARLDRVLRALAGSGSGGLRWPPVDLRTYRERLYLVSGRPVPDAVEHWSVAAELRLDDGMVLRPRRAVGAGLRPEALAGGVAVRFRRGGEWCRLPGRGHRHALKKLMQEAGVPPWQRQRVPLLVAGIDIAAIVGLACCDPYAAGPGEEGIEVDVVYQ